MVKKPKNKRNNPSILKIVCVTILAFFLSYFHIVAIKDALKGTQIEGIVVDSVMSTGRGSFFNSYTRVNISGEDTVLQTSRTLFNPGIGTDVQVVKNGDSYRVGTKYVLIFKALFWLTLIIGISSLFLWEKPGFAVNLIKKYKTSSFIIVILMISIIGA